MEIKKTFNEMSILSPALMAYTIVYFCLMVYDFAARAAFDLPTGIMGYYIALVGAYAADKEFRRWRGQEEPPRAGSFFVYLWAIFFLVAFVIRSFWPTFVIPEDLSKVALQVLGIFFGSKASKKIYEIKSGKALAVAMTRQGQVMEIVKANGKVTRREVAAAIKVSPTTAWRLLEAMEAGGVLKRIGEHKDAHYVAAGEGKGEGS